MATMRFHDIDISKHSVYALYAIGTRYAVGFRPQDAVERYLELHPHADRKAVEAELEEEIRKQQW